METKPVTENESKSDLAEMKNLRKWILKATSPLENKSGLSLVQIKKFLETKEKGLSKKPEIKSMMKNLLDSGRLVKLDRGKYAANVPQPKRKAAPVKSDVVPPTKKEKTTSAVQEDPEELEEVANVPKPKGKAAPVKSDVDTPTKKGKTTSAVQEDPEELEEVANVPKPKGKAEPVKSDVNPPTKEGKTTSAEVVQEDPEEANPNVVDEPQAESMAVDAAISS